MLPDEVPSVDLVLAGIGSAITPQANLPVQAEVHDDHDVAESTLNLYVNDNPPFAIPASAQSDGKIRQSIDLRDIRDQKKIQLEPGQTVSLTLLARDYFDLHPSERFGRSNPIQLSVVTPSQLLILLERRELAMRSRMELIVSELNQLRELLTRMRQTNRQAINPSTTEAQSPDGEQEPSDDKLQLLRAQQSTLKSKNRRVNWREWNRKLDKFDKS